MSKYIDAEELKSNYAPLEGCLDVRTLDGAKKIFDVFVDLMPASDVAEVRHGEWVFKFYCGNMSGYDYGMKCSVCGKPTYRQFAEKMPPYCPNCGASMVNEDV